jgi:predicted nuclease of predicted toxin-antitoxin system
MDFIVDECTGAAVAEDLRAAGHDVVVVAESMSQADDQTILNRAFDENRILITNDKDFGELVFRQGFLHHGVLLLRLQDDSSANRVRVVKTVLGQYGELLKMNFLVATETQIRVRRKTEDLNDIIHRA